MQKEQVEQKAREMISHLKNTEEYSRYLNSKAVISERTELWDKVNAFRKKTFEIQVNKDYGQFEAFERLNRLKKDYEPELQNPVVNAFLDADYELCKEIRRIYRIIAEELNYDMSFMD